MVAASKFAPPVVGSSAAPKRNPAVERFVALFRALRKTKDVPERLALQGLATRGPGGALVLRDDVREQLEDLEARLQASLDAGASYREAVEAARLDVDHRKVTYVVYALFRKDGGVELYIGETGRTPAERFAEHPSSDCTKLLTAMEETGGKDAWTCAVLLVLPEDARSKELLLYVEARIQRLLDTVDGAHGRNCHYGAGTYGGAPDEDSWLENYVELIEFVSEHGKLPSAHSKDAGMRSLGKWSNRQRQTRDNMSAHRHEALEALGSAWMWRIKAPYVTNAVLFAKLREDERVIASGGVDIPVDIPGVDAMRVFNARQHYRTKKMPEADRITVAAEFPGLAMTKHDVSFYLSAQAFAAKHPGAKTSPSREDERVMYNWLSNLRNGDIDTDAPWRKKVLGDFGISSILDMRKSAGVRTENVARKNALNAEWNTERSAMRDEVREAEKRMKIDDVKAGPAEGC